MFTQCCPVSSVQCWAQCSMLKPMLSTTRNAPDSREVETVRGECLFFLRVEGWDLLAARYTSSAGPSSSSMFTSPPEGGVGRRNNLQSILGYYVACLPTVGRPVYRPFCCEAAKKVKVMVRNGEHGGFLKVKFIRPWVVTFLVISTRHNVSPWLRTLGPSICHLNCIWSVRA